MVDVKRLMLGVVRCHAFVSGEGLVCNYGIHTRGDAPSNSAAVEFSFLGCCFGMMWNVIKMIMLRRSCMFIGSHCSMSQRL